MSDTNGEVATVAKATVSAFSEIGVSGLRVSGGRVIDEFNRNLSGDKAVKVYREMADNDPIAGALLFAIEMLVREVAWRAEPAGVDGRSTPEAEGWATFLEECIGDMSSTWSQTVSSIVTFLPYGWSFLEVVYKRRDGHYGLIVPTN